MQDEQGHITSALLTRFILGEVSQVEQLMIIEWLEADPANQLELDKLEAAWLKSGELNPAPLPVDVPLAWNKLEDRLDNHDKQKSMGKRLLMPIIYAAASIALIVVLLNIFNDNTVDVEPMVLSNMTGVTRTDTLPDGSIVTLNYGSRLTYLSQANDMHRYMLLEGEAFFDVVRDTLRPFVIKAGMGGVRVLGTSFNVKVTNTTDVTVDVKTGLVELFYPATNTDTLRLELKAGERGILSHQNNTLSNQQTSASSLFWLDRTLIFKNKPLHQVFDVLEQCYQVTIICDDDNIKLTNLSSTFKDKELNQVLDVIAATFDIAYSQNDKEYRIYRP